MVNLVSVSDNFVSAMTLMGEQDKPSFAVKQTLESLICSLHREKLETDLNEAR